MQTRILLLGTVLLSLNVSAKVRLATDLTEHPQAQSGQYAREAVVCLLDKVGLDAKIDEIPWARAKRQLEVGDVDGIFLTSPGEFSVGVTSTPVILEKWYAFTHEGFDPDDAALRVGAVRGSAQEQWLLDRGYKTVQQTNNLEQLVRLFVAKRIDLFVADDIPAKSLIPNQVVTDRHFIRYSPRTITFSSAFAKQHQQQINRLDDFLPVCNPHAVTLNADEVRQLSTFVFQRLYPLLDAETLNQISLLLQDESVNQDIAGIEKQWLQERQTGEYHLISEFLHNPVARALRKIKQSLPEIGEIMITNADGRMLAMSDVTTDYYQGDEAKVTELSNKSAYVSEMQFDASTRAYEVQYSTRLRVGDQDVIFVIGLYPEQLFMRHPAWQK